MSRKQKTYETDPMELRSRRRKRRERERRLKWFLSFLTVLIIILIAIIFRRIALRHFDEFKAPLENPTYWYEQTQDILFLTSTPTPTSSPTATVPTPTPSPTATFTPTLSPTPTLTPTPKLRPRKTVDGNAADLLETEESIRRINRLNEIDGSYSEEYWFEPIGTPQPFDASVIYPNADCTWMGVAGVLIDNRNEPQYALYIRLGFPDGTFHETQAGLFPDIGDSGYLIEVARPVHPFEEAVWIQILDEKYQPASERLSFRPSSNCQKSLTMINFMRTR